ncbi:MAG: dienelactone hydrolase family protein [Syntrophaceae bacterium]|nr:dienelactone hydrolase family protein [Syntrophaceae bacterium]
MSEERIFISCGRIELEGLIHTQEALSSRTGVIFCHPHPQYGGNMHNLVISSAVEAACEEGFSTLRFNFRGVGRSSGEYAEGVGEREDVAAVIGYFSSRLKDDRPLLIVLGYSFGAWAGLPLAVEDKRVFGTVAIAPPLEMYDFDFLKGCQKSKLFIAGDQDIFCPASRLEKWYQTLEEPKSMVIIPGADHFFFSHHRLLIQPLREFFRMIKSKAAGSELTTPN